MAIFMFLALVFSLKVTPSVSPAPATLTITVHVEPNPAARALLVVLEGDGDYSRNSQIPMEGDKAPTTNRFEWRRVPSGDYLVTGYLLTTSDRILARVVQQVTVQ